MDTTRSHYDMNAIRKAAKATGLDPEAIRARPILAQTAEIFGRLPAELQTPAQWHAIKAEFETERAEYLAGRNY